MCHAVRVKLSPAEAKEVRRLHGMMVPVYASLALLALAAVTLSSAPRSGETVVVATNAAPVLAAADRGTAERRAQD